MFPAVTFNLFMKPGFFQRATEGMEGTPGYGLVQSFVLGRVSYSRWLRAVPSYVLSIFSDGDLSS